MILTLAGLTLLTVPGLTIQSYGYPYVDLQVKPLIAYHGPIEVQPLIAYHGPLEVKPQTAYNGKLEVKPLRTPSYQLPSPYSIDKGGNIYLTPANVDFLVKQTKLN